MHVSYSQVTPCRGRRHIEGSVVEQNCVNAVTFITDSRCVHMYLYGLMYVAGTVDTAYTPTVPMYLHIVPHGAAVQSLVYCVQAHYRV